MIAAMVRAVRPTKPHLTQPCVKSNFSGSLDNDEPDGTVNLVLATHPLTIRQIACIQRNTRHVRAEAR